MERALLWPRSVRAGRWLDGGLCASVAAVGIGGQIAASAGLAVDSSPVRPSTVLAAIATGAVLWWRRGRPLTTVGVLVVFVVVAAGISPPGLYGAQVALAFVVASYALGSWCERRWAVLAVGTALVAITVLGAAGNGGGIAAAAAVALALLALPIVAGVAARSRRRELEEVEARLAESEHRQEERARLAIEDERNRIARELHDVVAHHVSLIGVQAGAARASLGTSPEATRQALSAIEESSRTAVGEMHQLVEVLRPLDGADRAPQPGLYDLAGLVGRWREAGFTVSLDQAPLHGVAPTLGLSCFRIVEEALTNVARHSLARTATVAVRDLGPSIEVSVRDPGPAAPPPHPVGGGGRGLAGMAERATLFGGSVAAGPTSDGGFAVVACLPRVGPR